VTDNQVENTPEAIDPPEMWKTVGRTRSIHRKFEFADYASTSVFLDALSALSEETGLYPDLSFATTYVSVTIPAGESSEEAKLQHDFALNCNNAFEG